MQANVIFFKSIYYFCDKDFYLLSSTIDKNTDDLCFKNVLILINPSLN